MQTVRLVSGYGDLLFSTDLPDGRPTPYAFESIYGIGITETEVYETQGIDQQGSTLHGRRSRPRDIELGLYCYGWTRDALYEARLTLNALIAYPKLIRIEYENDYAAWYTEGVVTSMDYDPRISIGGNFTPIHLVIHCPDSTWRRMNAETDAQLEYQGGLFWFPFFIPEGEGIQFGPGGYTAVIDNAGTVETPVEIWIYGPALLPRLDNETTGQSIVLNTALAPYEHIYINTTPQQKKIQLVNALNQTTVNAWDKMVFGSNYRLWALTPGRNAIRYFNEGQEDISDTRIEMTWIPRAGGV